jgi:hypothetical protein
VPRLSFTDTRTGATLEDVTMDGLAAELARELALGLAPVRDTSAVRGGGVPDRISLLTLLGMADVDADVVAQRWRARTELGPVPIGGAAQEPFRVDLRHDGPHALVAGTTGSGKSELLQTLIAALALAHPPERLSFLLVDYKGGAAFKECVGFPHTVGFVTDLDGHLAQRALVSLNAELRRREHLLRDSGTKDLLDMEQRAPGRAPASLLIVIDEFATLAKEVPEFVDGVVDVAQRGRSLGVHLLLATQRPGGVVSENIRANTNLRIALRVNEAGESSDVIGAADAAHSPRSPRTGVRAHGPRRADRAADGLRGRRLGRAARDAGHRRARAPVRIRARAGGGHAPAGPRRAACRRRARSRGLDRAAAVVPRPARRAPTTRDRPPRRTPALRYRNLHHRELDSELTVYVVPTSRGAATIACTAQAVRPVDDAGASGLARCEDIAATLTLRDTEARSLEPSEQYGAAVDLVIGRLVRARAPARIALDEAADPAGQRRHARRIAGAYRAARRSLARIEPGLVEAPVHRAMVGALDSAAGAYGALSRAARDGDAAAFERAKANVRGAEDAFRRAVGALGKLGYRIG